MTQGKATATISGRVIADTDEYEIVEGNVYVGPPFLDKTQPQTSVLTDMILVPTFVSRRLEMRDLILTPYAARSRRSS